MPGLDIGQLIIYVVVLLLAFSVHEAAHAWMSYKFGDDTAYLLGRVTLNPAKHVDPIGSLLIPIAGFIFASKGVLVPLIGWAKPTPVNPLRWRNKDLANVMVSIAGILANILVALIAVVLFKVLQATGLFSSGPELAATGSMIAGGSMPEETARPVALLLGMMLSMNASLAVFNLLPIPPLDGSKVLYSVLPAGARPALEALEQYGFLLLLMVVYFGVVNVIFTPVARLIAFVLTL